MVTTNQKTAMQFGTGIKKWSQWLYGKLKINACPVIRVYHSFGDNDGMIVFGHALRMSPFPQERFRKRYLNNTISLLRLFLVKPYENATLRLVWQGESIETKADKDGFFRFEWIPAEKVAPGWYEVRVELLDSDWPQISGTGKIMVPAEGDLGLISDIDDTFLMSYSTSLPKKLYVLLTRNAKTRKPFEGVVQHYQLLASGGNETAVMRPFFYVSSSEWNLYDYIRVFSDACHMPEGVYLLSQIKEIQEFWKTGSNKHKTKYIRIVRILEAFPNRQFVLLGDDSQADPYIYKKLVKDFPGRIHCVYLRHIRKVNLEKIRALAAEMQKGGTEVCYFRHSKTAIEHSRKFGLIQ